MLDLPLSRLGEKVRMRARRVRRSVAANLALIESNARVAAEIAVALTALAEPAEPAEPEE